MVACNALTALDGRGNLVGPPPINWVVHVCELIDLWGPDVERPYINDHGNFKIKYQTCIFIFLMITSIYVNDHGN